MKSKFLLMTIGLPVHAIAVQAQQKEVDLSRYLSADEVAAIAQVSKAASNLKKRWEENTEAIASSLDDPDVKVTAELLTQNGYKPNEGVRLKVIN